MQRVETIVHQLDTALTELRSASPVRARLAGILVDNATEVMLHFQAEEGARRSDPVPPGVRLALGERFAPKVKYAEQLKLLSPDQARFVREAHKFRCEAYHAGRLHEQVMREIAHEYFAIACQLLRRCSNWGLRMRIGSEIPEVVHRYARADDPGLFLFNGDLAFSRIADELVAARPRCDRSLSVALAAALQERIEFVELGVQTLFRAEADCQSVDDLIVKLEGESFFYSHAPEGGFRFHRTHDGDVQLDPAHQAAMAKAREAMRRWRPTLSTTKLERWRRRINGLRGRSDVGSLLQAYRDLSDEMRPFEDTLRAAWGWFEVSVGGSRPH